MTSQESAKLIITFDLLLPDPYYNFLNGLGELLHDGQAGIQVFFKPCQDHVRSLGKILIDPNISSTVYMYVLTLKLFTRIGVTYS